MRSRLPALVAVLACLNGWPVAGPAHATDGELSLGRVVSIAQRQSRAAVQARNRYEASYWQYRTYRAAFLPTLSLSVVAPYLARTLTRIPRGDGTEAFVRQSFLSTSGRLALGKTIGTTGGEVFIETSLERLDLLDGGPNTSYLSRPVSVGLRQPLFAYNTYAWQQRIEPLRFEQASREYAEELESVAIGAAQNFFDLLAAQDQYERARENLARADTLYAVTEQRFAAGRTPRSELLQTHLAQLNARLELQRTELDLRARRYSFGSYLGMAVDHDVVPGIGFEVPDVTVDPVVAVEKARQNRSDVVGFQRRTLESEREVAEARAGSGRNVNLYATFGLSQSTDDLRSVYRTGQESEQATVAFEVPILDWGRARTRSRLAESNREVTRHAVEQSRQDLDQDVTMKALQFNVQRERIRIAATADSIASQGFEAAERAYLSGHGDARAVSLALGEKEAARRNHVDALRGYWVAWYELRHATLYDFRARAAIRPPEPRR